MSGSATFTNITALNALNTGTVIANTHVVTGASTLSGALNVSGATALASVTASGSLGVSGAASLATVTASGSLGVTGASTLSGALNVAGNSTLANVTAASGIINKNLVVSGATISKNDFMYVDATMPIPSTILLDPNFTATQGAAYFDKDTKIIYQGQGLFVDPVKRSEVLCLKKYPFFNYTVSIQFTDFSLVDICSSNGATLRSVSVGYDMRSLAATNEYVRWRANLAPITITYLFNNSIICQYAYWRMNMSGIYLDFINVTGGFETVNNLYWYPFINADMRKVLDGTTVQINTTSNTATLSKVGLYPDLGSPVNAYKFTASYIINEHHGMNDGFGRPVYNGHTWTSWLSNANELYEAMLNQDIWDTKYTNQEVAQGGPKFDNVDTANNYNMWNFGAKYSDANWNAYYTKQFISFVTATRVGTVADSNIYYPGPMSYGGLDNYLKIQLPVNNNCWGTANVANATAFVQGFGTSILPLRPVMKVTEGMSYFDWCECVTYLFQQDANDPHCGFNLYTYSAPNITPYATSTVPLNETGFIGSQFIANNGKMLVPYTFPQFYAVKGTLTYRGVSTVFSSRDVANTNRAGVGYYLTSSTSFKSNVYSLIGKAPYRPSVSTSFTKNLNTVGFHYTDPIFYTDYAFGVISNALSSNNFSALSPTWNNRAALLAFSSKTPINRHNDLVSNVQFSNIYKDSIEYILNTSLLGLSGSLNSNNVVVPYSSNLSLVSTYYTANSSILYTGVESDIVPVTPSNAVDDFGPQYFGYYARKVSTGNAWNSTAWFNGMTTSFTTYKETLADTSFIVIDRTGHTQHFLFGQIDNDHMSLKTNSNVNVTSNVGWASICDGSIFATGRTSATVYPDGYMQPVPITQMATYGFNLNTKEIRGLFALKTVFASIYRSVLTIPTQYGGLNPIDLNALMTSAIYDYMHNTLKCDSIIYDLRGNQGGNTSICLSAGLNYAKLDSSNTWIDTAKVFQDTNKLSVDNKKWTPSEALYVGRKLGFDKETYRQNPIRLFFLNNKYPITTVYEPNDNVKIIKIADAVCASSGETDFSSEGFLTCGRVGNAKIIALSRNTAGASGAFSTGTIDPTISNSILPTQRRTSAGIIFNITAINGYFYANQGFSGLEVAVLGDAGVPGVNLTHPGNYLNPALDVGLRTGWQDAGVNGSDVAAVRDFFIKGPDYIKPASGPTLGNMKTQNWRDCDLERALLIDKNVSWDNFDKFSYYQANKSLFNYVPY